MNASTYGLPKKDERKPSNLLQNLSNDLLTPKRAADLTLLENIPCGPIDHKPTADDPHFARLEPYTGIHLSKRTLPYEALQSHFEGRYFLNFSKLYSVVREVPGSRGTKYEVPTDGEWITIGILAERGEIKFTNVVGSSNYEDDTKNYSKNSKTKNIGDGEDTSNPNRAKKYMSIKLVDLGKNGDKKGIRGDEMLTMLLFEADEVVVQGNEGNESKVYKGGSGGAFEACMKLHEGAVIAILQPKILKPYQRNGITNKLLAITPTSSENIAIIGHSRDLSMCGAMKADGKLCGSWCDKRIGEFCEYHIERAIKSRRASRPEFTAGTSGMSRTAAKATKNQGLLKEEAPSAAYIIPGHIIGGGPEYIGEKIGRGRAERQKKKREDDEMEEKLNKLLGKKLDNRARYIPPIPLPGVKKQAAPSRTIVTAELLASLQNDSKQVMLAVVLGAAGGIGQPLSLLLKINPHITALGLYDIVNTPGVGVDLSHINTPSKVEAYLPPDSGLTKTLTGADIVVIPAGVPRKPGINAGIVRDLATGIATTCPKAFILVISNPVNSTVPIVAEVLKKHNVFDPKRVFGVTTLDVVRASTFVAEVLADISLAPKTTVPVVGGHSGVTIVPLLSQSQPPLPSGFATTDRDALIHRIQFGGDEVVKAKDGAGSATLSMAYAGAEFATSVIKAINGEKGIIIPSYINLIADKDGAETVISDLGKPLEYFSVKVELGPNGVEKIHSLGNLTENERKLIAAAIPELEDNIQKGVEFITKPKL
ncbi:hypothetical protein Clacol_003572 [Clathrus columnatus]|uniref:malate dehydrogenase n=1 Tax=Clathrus columnatus TaxID=1419009 RepID=A0AAV5A8R5_9AGAM|nr:hypothetical protein Clacol_003572 [Clathrus columnatus]